MVYDAETTARNAEADSDNDPPGVGYCLQWAREQAGIGAYYGDAATAWANTNDRHPGDRNPPRGSMAYWTGGTKGNGHIAPSIGGGQVRSSDANGSGRVATVDVGWPERTWGLTYAGWSWDVNEVTIPHPSTGSDDVPTYLHLTRTEDTRVAAATWYTIGWTGEPSDPGGVHGDGNEGVLIGGHLYQSVFLASLSGLAPGTTLRTRTIEGDFGGPGGDWQVTETNRPVEHTATAGDTSVGDARIGKVASGKRLRFQIHADAAFTLTHADLTLTYW